MEDPEKLGPNLACSDSQKKNLACSKFSQKKKEKKLGLLKRKSSPNLAAAEFLFLFPFSF